MYIYPPLLLTVNQLIFEQCACAMQRAKKIQQKIPTLKKTTGLCPYRSYYSMLFPSVRQWCPTDSGFQVKNSLKDRILDG